MTFLLHITVCGLHSNQIKNDLPSKIITTQIEDDIVYEAIQKGFLVICDRRIKLNKKTHDNIHCKC